MIDDTELRERYAGEIGDFVDFLDEVKPALFVSASLTAILRTEPPVEFGPARVADLVAEWAASRASEKGGRVYEHLLSALRAIVDAYNTSAISDFRPKHFYWEFRNALMERCPVGEQAEFQRALAGLEGNMRGPESGRGAGDAESAAPALRAPVDAAPEAASPEQALTRLASNPRLSDEEFDRYFGALERAVAAHTLLPSPSTTARMLETAAAHFNAGAVGRAARMYELIDRSLEHPAVPESRRVEARSAMRRRQLNEELLSQCVNDPRRRAEVGPIVRRFEDFRPEVVMSNLVSEASLSRGQFLMNLLEAHGAAALPQVVAQFASPKAAAKGPGFLTSLVYLIARIGAPSDAARRKAIEAVGPMLTSEQLQARAAALAALRKLGGREVVPHAMRALEAGSYGAAGSEPSDDLKRHLGDVLDLLVDLDLEPSLAVVAEVAAGARDGGFKLGRVLRDLAVARLARRDGPLPPRAVHVIAEALKAMAGKRFVIITSGLTLGVDAEACIRLMELIQDSTDPEALAVLDLPVLRKLAARGDEASK